SSLHYTIPEAMIGPSDEPAAKTMLRRTTPARCERTITSTVDLGGPLSTHSILHRLSVGEPPVPRPHILLERPSRWPMSCRSCPLTRLLSSGRASSTSSGRTHLRSRAFLLV